ncbi:MAG: SPFH domain-containing protein, partial [Bacillota bacterium]|nr:SPFH domain-containing protein [Bacillota bacterium]
MGIFKFIKSQFIEVIEWTDPTTDTLVYRFPVQGNEIKMGAQLTVRESQAAIFVNEGQIADVFPPGRYQLTTENMPVMTKLRSWKYGFNSPFKAEVYFVNTKQFTNQKWGTANPIMMRDQEFGMLRLRAFGIFSFRVTDPAKFLKELFGTNSTFQTEDIAGQLRGMIISGMTDLVAESKIAALDLAMHYDELGAQARHKMSPRFGEFGLDVASF